MLISLANWEISFNCLKCGNCCRSIITPDHLGIFLFPKEAKKLRRLAEKRNLKLTIYPQQGFTYEHKKTIKPDIIYSYQIADKVCPFLIEEKNRCSIYEDRPSACRAFPVLTTIPVINLIPECNWVKQYCSSEQEIAGNPDSLRNEILHSSKINHWIQKYRPKEGIIWHFNLNTKRWECQNKK
jgi:Fe-S-cluster containining protein